MYILPRLNTQYLYVCHVEIWLLHETGLRRKTLGFIWIVGVKILWISF